MKNYKLKVILVPVDFSETSENALKQALRIAKKANARLILVHVIELNNYTVPAEIISLGLITEQTVNESKENLKALVSKTNEENNLDTEYACYIGSVYENIIRAAHLFNADLIVMGSHGTSGIREWLFGSNTYRVINSSIVPVLTIQAGTEINRFKKIVFPFNENIRTLNKISQVVLLATIFNATVLLLAYSNNKMKSTVNILREKGRQLTELFESGNIKSSFTIKHGNSYAGEILLYSTIKKADLVTVVTANSHKIKDLFKINADKTLVSHSEIPVLCVPVHTS